MTKATAIFFVFLYMLAMLRPIQPCIEYLLNQDYIAEFLCVNKDKPELQCNGKCHLAKELKKQQQQEPLTTLSVYMENYPIGFVNILNISKSTVITLKKEHFFYYKNLYNFNIKKSIFQPPII
ncbi:hypothetical protein [Seonamhaeicola sp. S2-3]|uniref:hypothetical protein n=1 Tax=Seonamhaeicola sp. S2-3 TaxID=1936081 RepID=UPI0012FC220A|nr:hypothetical protein [Seonamhaeicola sp. S2-3]